MANDEDNGSDIDNDSDSEAQREAARQFIRELEDLEPGGVMAASPEILAAMRLKIEARQRGEQPD